MDKIEVICPESEAFFKLITEVIERFKPVREQPPDKWISGPEATRMLRIKSKTTLQKLRDEGRIRYSQPDKKNILYDTGSTAELQPCRHAGKNGMLVGTSINIYRH